MLLANGRPSNTAMAPFFALVLVGLAGVASARTPRTVVEATGADDPTKLQVFTCQGLYSRNPDTSVYVVTSPNDQWWLSKIGGVDGTSANATAAAFVKQCLVDFPRVVLFNYTAQKELLPNIVTLGAVLDAVPVQQISDSTPPVVFDALEKFDGFTELESTAYVFDNYGNLTTGVAKQNPGWKWDNRIVDQFKPSLTGGFQTELVDFIVKERLFDFFLKDGCIPFTKEHALMERMLKDERSKGWGRPVVVYGYDNTHPLFGGSTFAPPFLAVPSFLFVVSPFSRSVGVPCQRQTTSGSKAAVEHRSQ